MNIANMKTNKNVIANPNNEDTFRRYLNDISKYKPLTRDEEKELFIRVNNGDEQAVEKICKHNLLFVVSVAKQYAVTLTSSNLTLEDLISEGNLGLCMAVKKFDTTTGFKFISYAVWWIRQRILACIQENIKSIRLPNNVRADINKIRKAEELLEQRLGRVPSSVEVFEIMLETGELVEIDETTKRGELHKRELKIDELKKMSRFETSLNSLASNDTDSDEIGNMVKCDDLTPDAIMISKERKELTLEMLSKIPSRAQDIIRDYYGIDTDPMTYKAIGEKYDVTAETARQIVDKNIRRLRGNNRKKASFFFGGNSSYGLRREFKDYDVNTIYLI